MWKSLHSLINAEPSHPIVSLNLSISGLFHLETFVLDTHYPSWLISVSTVGPFEFYGVSTESLDFICSLIGLLQNSLAYDWWIFCN